MLDIIPATELTDDMRLIGAVYTRFGACYDIDTWDDGFGPVWAYAECFGVRGIVRAQTWEDAYDAVIDEIMDDADPADVPTDSETDLPEGMYWRGNGVPSNPRLTSAMAQEDLNVSRLGRLPSGLQANDAEYFLIVERD